MSDSLSPQVSATFFIKYNPLLSKQFGSQNATLLFDRLEYWFSKKRAQFYKFIEPCDHPLCKTGDTWTEELGFSKKVFRTAFDKIGVRYRSKTEFEQEAEPFKGKFFAYYQDRQTKKTIFVRNDKLLADLYKNLKSLLSEKMGLPKEKKAGEEGSSGEKKGSPTGDPLGSPHVRAYTDKQIHTSYSDIKKSNQENRVEGDVATKTEIANQMVRIWTKVIGEDSAPTLTPMAITRLYDRFHKVFNGSMECWLSHCRDIGSSKFLMGEKGAYQLRFWVACSQSFKDNLEQDVFEVDTRQNKDYETFIKEEATERELKALEHNLSLVARVKSYLIKNHWVIYKSCFQAAQFQEQDTTLHITCQTSWAKTYVADNLTHLLETIETAFKTTVNVR